MEHGKRKANVLTIRGRGEKPSYPDFGEEANPWDGIITKMTHIPP